jgi:type I restriction enzyme R subunit
MGKPSATSRAPPGCPPGAVTRRASFSERLADLMRRGTAFAPPLNGDELAFYDAVAQNESALTKMGATVLADIARGLVRTLRREITTDWVSRDGVRAKIRSTIKRLLEALSVQFRRGSSPG